MGTARGHIDHTISCLLCLLAGISVTGCINNTVLDSARVLKAGTTRYQITASIPREMEGWIPESARKQDAPDGHTNTNAQSSDEDTNDWPDHRVWQARQDYPTYGILLRSTFHGRRNPARTPSQASFGIDSSGMVLVGGKFQLLDRGPWIVSWGGSLRMSLLSFLYEEESDSPRPPFFGRLSTPIWFGFEPASWFALYLTAKPQIWLYENLGTTLASSHTAGIRIGHGIHLLAEITHTYEVIHGSNGIQYGLSIAFDNPP